jgi:5'-deoxynucleotidase YfbR-like HD superfamily hydrolase
MSKRVRKAYLDKFIKELFPEGMQEAIKPRCKQPSEKEKLLTHAKRLRDLADSGMNSKKYYREAEKAEKAAELLP